MPAAPVTITPHDARRTAFRAVVAALQASEALEPYVSVWGVADGTDLSTTTLGVGENAVWLTPVFEREDVAYVGADGRRVWSCPVLVEVRARVASANVDNVINLAGLIEDAVCALDAAELSAAGISWIELSSPPAQALEYGTSAGAFRLMVYVAR